MRRFEFSMGGSDKFWEVELNGSQLTVRFGRMGTNGQTQTKDFPTDAAAEKEYNKLIADKLKKGYVELPASGGPVPAGNPAGATSVAAPATAAASTASSSKGGRSASAVKKVLEEAGVNTSTFEPVPLDEDEDEDEEGGARRRSDSDGSFYMVEVPKGIAMDVWRAVRNAVDTTGYWPIFTGDYYDLFQYLEFNEEEPASILKESNSINAPNWFKTHADENPEMFEEALASAPDGDNAHWNPRSRQANLEACDNFYVVKTIGDFSSTMILVPTKTPWHVAAVLRWGGSNDAIEPAEHTALHKYWHTEYGAEPVVASMDTWEFRVAKPPQTRAAAMELAREQYIYCPDIVDQGCGTVTGLASQLIDSLRWYFWWD